MDIEELDLETRDTLHDLLSLRLQILRMHRSLLAQQISKQTRQRRWYQRPLNSRRDRHGEFPRVVLRMRSGDPEKYLEYFRMGKASFEEILEAVRPAIEHPRNHQLVQKSA